MSVSHGRCPPEHALYPRRCDSKSDTDTISALKYHGSLTPWFHRTSTTSMLQIEREMVTRDVGDVGHPAV